MSFDSLKAPPSAVGGSGVFPRRALTIGGDDSHIDEIVVYLFYFNDQNLKIQMHRRSTTQELIEKIIEEKPEDFATKNAEDFELFEIMGTLDGKTFKERKLDREEYPVSVQTLWPRPVPGSSNEDPSLPRNRFVLRRKNAKPPAGQIRTSENTSTIDSFLAKFLSQPQRGLLQVKEREFADLCCLSELTEQTLLDNLRERFNNGHIYTYIGQAILIAVNPYQFYPIFGPKYASLYSQATRISSLPPHIFAISNIMYFCMLRKKESQVAVISGESGSGKTESTNFILHHLTTLTMGQKGSTGSSVEKMLLSAGPVLEAFGNAVTVQNNNSSRFGKFLKIHYRENGMVSGANVEIYLLEKSRIIQQAVGERNYHVFYYLLIGASEEEKKRHMLLPAKDYRYLHEKVMPEGDAPSEKYEFERLKTSMQLVGFCPITQQQIFGIISAVLLLGNVEFVKRPGQHIDENAAISNNELIDIIANLLGINTQQLSQALTMRKTKLKHDTVISRFHLAEAVNTRDAMAKCLYNSLFHWIVNRINFALIRREKNMSKSLSIGILDIFGFEDVGAHLNSFEQLCINYANEHLQAYFNQHIFQFEQEEYCKEGIQWTNIEWTDNTECVHLFNSKPYGLLRLIDEESNIHNGTDHSMLEKLNTFLKSNEYYEIPHKREDAFIIAHYAGKVKYQITNFREKNRDMMRQEVITVLKSGRSAFLRELVADDPVAVFRWNVLRAFFRAMNAFRDVITNRKRIRRAESLDRLLVPNEPLHAGSRRGSDTHLAQFLRGDLGLDVVPDFCDTSIFKTIVNRARRGLTGKPREDRQSTARTLQTVKELTGKRVITNKPTSVSRQFEYSLNRLMKTLALSTPYFIRCIKSNNEKVANVFDDNIILRQLRYTGMLETVRIRRAGYSIRMDYVSFAESYRILLRNGRESTQADIERFINEHPLIDCGSVQYGKTKIYLRDAEKLILDEQLHRVIMQHICTLQNWFRTIQTRRRFVKLRSGIIRLQARVRGMCARNEIRRQNLAATIIQTVWRRYHQERRYKQARRIVIALQAWIRGKRARGQFQRLKENDKTPIIHNLSADNKLLLAPSDARKQMAFDINRVHTISLNQFDLNRPESFAQFAADEATDTEEFTDELSSIEDEEDDVFEEAPQKLDDGMVEADLDATFILENTRLKLIGASDKGFQRRQSLATTASTAKLRMLRRAASTESTELQRAELISGPKSPNAKLKFTKIGFNRARKHLKSLWTRRGDELSEDDTTMNEPTTSLSTETEKTSVEAKRGHHFKATRLHRSLVHCALCNRSLSSLLVQGLKCTDCRLTFHKECSSFATNIPCVPPLSPTRSDTPSKPTLSSFASSFNLTKTKQQTDPTAHVISGINDLRQFSVFIFKKQCQLDQEKKRETVMDAIFKKSLREFHMELIGSEAVFSGERGTVLRYHDLITTFEGLLVKMCRNENIVFPTTLGVNAFRGFLNEFMAQQGKRRGSAKKTTTSIIRKVRKQRRRSDVTLINGHRFKPDFVHVPTYCEFCDQFMWHAEKIFICLNCRLSVHKKCHTKVNGTCARAVLPAVMASGRSRFFGADLAVLTGDDLIVPPILNNMLMAIEIRGLFVEGLYRKSGSVAEVKRLRNQIELAEDWDNFSFDEVPVHVLTTLIKGFFRELNEPLITFELYENFINVSEVKDMSERLRCLSVVVDLLPRANRCVFDRLMYHLARVAHQETINRMTASNLSVIFAPCILRRNQAVHAQEQLMDVKKQGVIVQMMIEEKLRVYKTTLNQIVELEAASEKVTENLRKIEEHRRSSAASVDMRAVQAKAEVAAEKLAEVQTVAASGSTPNLETARQLFEEQLEFLDHEKSKLIQELPPLAPVASSEDLTASDAENSARNSPCGWDSLNEEYAIDMEAPPVFNRLPSLSKNRRPRRSARLRPPSNEFIRQLGNQEAIFGVPSTETKN
ncbi:hypothetical protein M3Y95_00958000 [Aphelenchoides besseyi]|nr:hypothetical protein M3Y95_00958000 [Aphelenchoides besseyi]